MAKFMILYSSSYTATELMASATPEQMEASMDEWLAWRDKASKAFKVEFGLPLQAVSKITVNGVTESESLATGYSIVEGESKDALLEILKTHPHLLRSGASIDVFEMLPIPGVEP